MRSNSICLNRSSALLVRGEDHIRLEGHFRGTEV